MSSHPDREPFYVFACQAFSMLCNHARFGVGPGGDLGLELRALIRALEEAERALVEDGIAGSESIAAVRSFLGKLIQVARDILDPEPRHED